MQLPVNTFKKAIADGRQQIGVWASLPSPYTAEVLAVCGYDWILFDTEHAPADPITVTAQLQAAAAYPVSAIARPAANDPVLIKRLLDSGAQTLIVPYVQNVAEAQAAVAAMRYPPRGIRGAANVTRAARFGTVANYAQTAERELCLIVQVETAEALAEIEAIAAVDGVDGIFIGPADLAASMGLAGQLSHPDVVAAIEDAITRITRAGKPAGILTLDPAFARRCIDLGTIFTAIDIDAAALVRGLSDRLAAFRGL